MAYSLKNVANQKPATLTGVLLAGLTAVQTSMTNPPISDAAALKWQAFLALLLGLFWVDAVTTNSKAAEEAKGAAFLQGLALTPDDGTVEALNDLGEAPPVDPAPDAVAEGDVP